MLWRIHEAVAGSALPDLQEVLSACGDTVQVVSGHVLQLPPPPAGAGAGEIAMALTTLQDARSLGRNTQLWPYRPGLYFDSSNYNVSSWLPRLPQDVPILNRSSFFCPVGLIATLPHIAWLDLGAVFVRPDSGLKRFTGYTIEGIRGWPQVAQALLEAHPTLGVHELVQIAPARQIAPVEWRFWIAEHQVIGQAQYSWYMLNERNEAESVPEQVLALALEIAQRYEAPHPIYVLDVVQSEGEVFANELNAFSTSGLYNVDVSSLMPAAREVILRDAKDNF